MQQLTDWVPEEMTECRMG